MKKFLVLMLALLTVFIISCGSDDDDSSSDNKCTTVGETRCSKDGKGFETCTKESDTLNVWKETKCTGEEVCEVVDSVAGCAANNHVNATDCTSDSDCTGNTDGNTVCKDDGLCGAPSNEINCTSDADCANAPDGKTVCKDDGLCGVPSNETRCTSDADCANASDGKISCKGDGLCGFPAEGCSNPCSEDESGTTQCDGDMLQTCTLKTDLNCYNWDDTTDCAAENKICDDMAVAMCVEDIK